MTMDPTTMSNPVPRVSIGMPVYNGEDHLRTALDSILAQSFRDFELIISDNASTDRTRVICQEYAARDPRIRLFHQDENIGAAANYNFVFHQARGEYFKWMAHDDLIAPSYIELCVGVLEQNPGYVVCMADRYWMTNEGEVLGNVNDPVDRMTRPPFHRIKYPKLVSLPGSCFPIMVFGLMRTAVLARTGLIGAYNAADITLMAEMRLLGEFWQLPDKLFFERLHAPTPDYLRRQSARGLAAWYNPKKKHKLVFPNLKIAVEHLKALWRSDLSLLKKLRNTPSACIGRCVARLHLAGEPLMRRLWTAWSRISFKAARMSRTMGLFLRLWALFGFLRRFDFNAVRLAFSRPWLRENVDLLTFVALRLGRRPDPHSEQLLISWLHGTCPARSEAARRAMSQLPERFGAILQQAPVSAGSTPHDPPAPPSHLPNVVEPQL